MWYNIPLMRVFVGLSVFAALVLSGAAVWMGALNQDEGWYLYAANLVADGQSPYRDFFFTQGPVLPEIYSFFTGLWKSGGLLAARVFNLVLGLAGVLLFCAMASRLEERPDRKGWTSLVVFFLLATNLYHLYYLAIPKSYALASLFVALGFYFLSFVLVPSVRLRTPSLFALLSGLSLALATGVRISLLLLVVFVFVFLFGGAFRFSFPRKAPLFFLLGAFVGLALAYGPFLFDDASRAGLLAAQRYHAAREGFDVVWIVGSLSRLVRWYLPLFLVLGLGLFLCAPSLPKSRPTPVKVPGVSNAPSTKHWTPSTKHWALSTFFPLAAAFLVIAAQTLAPFPYEDYHVPVMGLLAVGASLLFAQSFASVRGAMLLVLGLSFATSFGSPLLEKWTTNGQDRFWTLKKEKTELAQLRDVARKIRALDPDGTTLLTQDLYLAIETNRKVPKGLEMGPFSMLSTAQWETLLRDAPATCRVAALSGYSFAIEPPRCAERDVATQLKFWNILKESYAPAFCEEAFGQNATPLLVLTRP